MSFMLEIRRRGRHVAGSILGALLFAYFMFHAIQGDRGFFAWIQLKQQTGYASANLAATETKRTTLERRIALLRDDQLDRDMLDERVRRVTGLGGRNEIVIYDAERTGGKINAK
jgi:cell division protein FtsB